MSRCKVHRIVHLCCFTLQRLLAVLGFSVLVSGWTAAAAVSSSGLGAVEQARESGRTKVSEPEGSTPDGPSVFTALELVLELEEGVAAVAAAGWRTSVQFGVVRPVWASVPRCWSLASGLFIELFHSPSSATWCRCPACRGGWLAGTAYHCIPGCSAGSCALLATHSRFMPCACCMLSNLCVAGGLLSL